MYLCASDITHQEGESSCICLLVVMYLCVSGITHQEGESSCISVLVAYQEYESSYMTTNTQIHDDSPS
jgi:hypothetical protein